MLMSYSEWRESQIVNNAYDRVIDTLENNRSLTSGFVYIIAASTYYKIGSSYQPLRRLAQIQPHCPIDVHLIHVIPAGIKAELSERSLHALYREYHRHHEWYKLPLNVLEDICTITSF